MRSVSSFVSAGAASLLFLAVACGSGGDTSGFEEELNSGSTGASGSSGSSGDGFGGSSGGASGSSGGGAACAATAAATEKPTVDIVFVIDNSGSMNGEMAEVQRNVNTFAQKIGQSGLDYRVVFIVRRTGSGNKICVPEPLAGADCADNLPTFRHVDQSVGSNDSLKLVVSTYDRWKESLRPQAFKVFVVVSDDGDSDQAATAFDAALLAKDPAQFGTAEKRNYMFHSICAWKEGTAVDAYNEVCPTSDGNGRPYRDIAKLTGGIVDSVCKTDYSGVLENLAKGIVDKLACELGVPTAAAADPTKVSVRSTAPGGAVTDFTQVTDAAKCGQFPNAWYYDDPAKPSKIVLCADSCGAVASVAGTKVEALVGCKTSGPR